MKKLILLLFLVFGQFLARAQKPVQKAQQTITMNLLPVGPVHLPKLNTSTAKGKDKKNTSLDLAELSQNKNMIIEKQALDTVIVQNDTVKSSEKTVLYTITSL